MSAVVAQQYVVVRHKPAHDQIEVKRTKSGTLVIRPLQDRIREFARVANHGGTFAQLVERAKNLDIEGVPAVRTAINAKRPPMSIGQKVSRFLRLVAKDGVEAGDLLRKAEADGIDHVHVVRDTIADAYEKILRPNRAKILSVGRFHRPVGVVHMKGKKKKK